MTSVKFSSSLSPSCGEFTPSVPSPYVTTIGDDDGGDGGSDDDNDSIPYHARENARPFTYGTLPAEFRTNNLKHVMLEEAQTITSSVEDSSRPKGLGVAAACPLAGRKSMRPSISPSRPLLRKTLTRQEFEDMLMERQEQSLRERRTYAIQQAQNAAIQRDLDELQQILGANILCKPTSNLKVSTKPPEKIVDIETRPQGARTVEKVSSCRDVAVVVQSNTVRCETPSFPPIPKRPLDDRCISPYSMVSPGTPTLQRLHPSTAGSVLPSIVSKPNGKSIHCQVTGNTALPVSEPHNVAPHLVKFARDYSEFWYKPHISREDATALLRSALPGTFIIRNSTTYKNAFGLVVRVEKPPQGVVVAENSSGEELVRHFLLEPTMRGVRLKGCTNEPVFSSLSALVYQHSINSMALPIKLRIPDQDLLLSAEDSEMIAAQKQLQMQGAACNVLYLYSGNMESLTGDEAIRKAVSELFLQRPPPAATVVHFKVSQLGITLTDNSRRVFFRRHYTARNISHCGLDPETRLWSVMQTVEDIQSGENGGDGRVVNKTIFAFVARQLSGCSDNQCHVFCDLAPTQPASAIISFANRVICMDKSDHQML